MIRVCLCLLLALGSTLAAASQADARRAKNSYSRVYGYQSPYRENSQSAECVRANDVDPSGNYSGYPCWARWALSPKGRPR